MFASLRTVNLACSLAAKNSFREQRLRLKPKAKGLSDGALSSGKMVCNVKSRLSQVNQTFKKLPWDWCRIEPPISALLVFSKGEGGRDLASLSPLLSITYDGVNLLDTQGKEIEN